MGFTRVVAIAALAVLLAWGATQLRRGTRPAQAARAKPTTAADMCPGGAACTGKTAKTETAQTPAPPEKAQRAAAKSAPPQTADLAKTLQNPDKFLFSQLARSSGQPSISPSAPPAMPRYISNSLNEALRARKSGVHANSTTQKH
jgi:hypothetical protein